jgi:hypothetical protein
VDRPSIVVGVTASASAARREIEGGYLQNSWYVQLDQLPAMQWRRSVPPITVVPASGMPAGASIRVDLASNGSDILAGTFDIR